MEHLLKTAPVISYEEELELLQKHDKDADAAVLHSRIPWIYRIVDRRIPSWVSCEDVVSDVILDVIVSLPNFDPCRASLNTYLFYIVTRAANRSVAAMSCGTTSYDEAYEVPVESSPAELLEKIRLLLDREDDISNTDKLIITRMFRGRSNADIARELECSTTHMSSRIKELRLFVSWKMVSNGMSAEPWVQDDDLIAMSHQYEQSRVIPVF